MKKHKEPACVRDELGFTPQDYEDMQAKDSGDLRGDTLCGRWDVTREQVEAINEGDRFAVDMFFYINEKMIRRLAGTFLHKLRGFPHGEYAYLLTVDDCFNQAYIDMRRGFLHFELDDRCIVGLLCHSFRYACVGGFGDEDGVFYYQKPIRARSACVIAKQNGVDHVSTF